jgi:hypothetical protein
LPSDRHGLCVAFALLLCLVGVVPEEVFGWLGWTEWGWIGGGDSGVRNGVVGELNDGGLRKRGTDVRAQCNSRYGDEGLPG